MSFFSSVDLGEVSGRVICNLKPMVETLKNIDGQKWIRILEAELKKDFTTDFPCVFVFVSLAFLKPTWTPTPWFFIMPPPTLEVLLSLTTRGVDGLGPLQVPNLLGGVKNHGVKNMGPGQPQKKHQVFRP